MSVEKIQIGDLVVDFLPSDEAGGDMSAVFVHGASGGSWYWHNWMRRFSQQGFDCYGVNLRGHMPSARLKKIGKVSILEYVEDVESVLKTLNKNIVLIGHSMGGLISQKIVADQKFPVKALVVTGSAPPKGVKLYKPEEKGVLNKLKSFVVAVALIGKWITKGPLIPVFRATKHYVANCIPEEEQRAFHDRLVVESSQASIDVYKGVIDVNLAQIDIPKLMVSGEKDMISVLRMQKKIAQYHDMDMKSFPENAHMLMIEPGWQSIAEDIFAWMKDKGVA